MNLVSESHAGTTSTTSRVPRSTCCSVTAEGIIASSACIAASFRAASTRAISTVRARGRANSPICSRRVISISSCKTRYHHQRRHDAARAECRADENRQRAGLKTIATNDFHYLMQEDARAQDIMLCIGTGSNMDDENRMRFENDQFYMKTGRGDARRFARFPRGMRNTVEVAEKCNV